MLSACLPPWPLVLVSCQQRNHRTYVRTCHLYCSCLIGGLVRSRSLTHAWRAPENEEAVAWGPAAAARRPCAARGQQWAWLWWSSPSRHCRSSSSSRSTMAWTSGSSSPTASCSPPPSSARSPSSSRGNNAYTRTSAYAPTCDVCTCVRACVQILQSGMPASSAFWHQQLNILSEFPHKTEREN